MNEKKGERWMQMSVVNFCRDDYGNFWNVRMG